jgi:hypothetical protein
VGVHHDREREIDILKQAIEFVLEIGRDREDAVFVIEDRADDPADGQGDGIEGRPFLLDDLVGRILDLLVKRFELGHIVGAALPAFGAIARERNPPTEVALQTATSLSPCSPTIIAWTLRGSIPVSFATAVLRREVSRTVPLPRTWEAGKPSFL